LKRELPIEVAIRIMKVSSRKPTPQVFDSLKLNLLTAEVWWSSRIPMINAITRPPGSMQRGWWKLREWGEGKMAICLTQKHAWPRLDNGDCGAYLNSLVEL